MKKSLAVSGVVALTAIALALTGCSSSKSSKSSGSSSTGSSSSGKKVKILYIPQAAGNAYFEPITKGMQDVCNTLGTCQVDESAPTTSDATSQIPQIQAAAQKGYDAVAISANNVDAVKPSLEAFKSQTHGLVIAVNSPIADGVADATINPTDFGTIGASMLKMMKELSCSGGKWDILSATENAPGQTAWIKQMKDQAGKGDFTGLSIGSVKFGNDEAAKSTTVMNGMLSSGSKCINAPTAAGLPAAAKVLSGSPKKSSVALTGLALPSSMKAFVTDGTVKEFGLWNVPAEGWATAALVMAIHNGTLKPANGSYANQSFTYTPPAGSASTTPVTLQLDSTATTNASPFVVFNSQNISSYNF